MLKNNKLYLILTGLLILVFSAQAGWAQELSIGGALPMGDRQMTGVDGAQVSLNQIRGAKGTVVIFWCTSCPWVQKYEDRVVALGQAYQARGFGFMLVNSNDAVAYPDDNLDAMKVQAHDHKYPFRYVVDEGSVLAKAFGAMRTPHVFVFDANNVLAYTGALDDSPSDAGKVEQAYLSLALDAIAAGSAVAVQSTKAFGCTIKFQ